MNIEDGLTRRIIEAIIEVHRTLGPGFLETIYRRSAKGSAPPSAFLG